jgi:hypothetical protein
VYSCFASVYEVGELHPGLSSVPPRNRQQSAVVRMPVRDHPFLEVMPILDQVLSWSLPQRRNGRLAAVV